MQYGFVIDHRKCIGCHACTVACKSENEVPVGDFRTWVKYVDKGTFPEVKRHFTVLRCNHCDAAPCVEICPTVALHKRPDAIVDLDVIRQQRERSWLDPLRYLAGRLPVAATGRVRSGNGDAQVEVQSVEVAGVPVPASVLQELVRHFTRTGANPDGTRLDQSIPLPYGITELRLSPDQAVVVQ